jgi:hypothetical protein
MSIETMKLALEALDEYKYAEARTALRQAIEQAQSVVNQSLTTEQEPVTHWSDCAVHSEPAYPKGECDCGGFAASPQRQPEQEPVAWSYWQSCLNDDGTQTSPWVHRLSIYKPEVSIINKDITPLYTAPPQRQLDQFVDTTKMVAQEQEPDGHFLDTTYCDTLGQVHVYQDFFKGQPFYASPPQRQPWVGLTDEEIMEMLDYGQYGRVPQYARNFVNAIEAKLKEKNT